MKTITVLTITRSVQRSVMAAPSASLDEAIAVARRRPVGSPAGAFGLPSTARTAFAPTAA